MNEILDNSYLSELIEKKCKACGNYFKLRQDSKRQFCSLSCMYGKEVLRTDNKKSKNKCFLCNEYETYNSICENCLNKEDNKEFWINVNQISKIPCKIVAKPWGGELIPINHENYCLKFLIFFKYSQFSFHFHHLKREEWVILTGSFEAMLDDDLFYLEKGDRLELMPNQPHQLQAREHSIIIEVSTQDFVEDSYRIHQGIN